MSIGTGTKSSLKKHERFFEELATVQKGKGDEAFSIFIYPFITVLAILKKMLHRKAGEEIVLENFVILLMISNFVL